MNRQEYISQYNKKYNHIIPDRQKDYKIDNDYIYHKWTENWLKYSKNKTIYQ